MLATKYAAAATSTNRRAACDRGRIAIHTAPANITRTTPSVEKMKRSSESIERTCSRSAAIRLVVASTPASERRARPCIRDPSARLFLVGPLARVLLREPGADVLLRVLRPRILVLSAGPPVGAACFRRLRPAARLLRRARRLPQLAARKPFHDDVAVGAFELIERREQLLGVARAKGGRRVVDPNGPVRETRRHPVNYRLR